MNGFVNPYNFIKFPQNKAKAYTDTDKHSRLYDRIFCYDKNTTVYSKFEF